MLCGAYSREGGREGIYACVWLIHFVIQQKRAQHHKQLCGRSVTQSCQTLRNSLDSACQASLSSTISWSLLKLMSIESVMPSNHLILCRPLLLLPPVSRSIRVFSNELALHIGGQSTGASASASVLPVNTQGRSPLGWTGMISLQSKGLSRVFANTTSQKHQFFGAQPSL